MGKWRHLETPVTQPKSERPHKVTESPKKSRSPHCTDSITEDCQTSIGINIGTKTVQQELYGMGFNGRVAACKPHITKYNSNDQKEWSKGHCYWTLEQWKCL